MPRPRDVGGLAFFTFVTLGTLTGAARGGAAGFAGVTLTGFAGLTLTGFAALGLTAVGAATFFACPGGVHAGAAAAGVVAAATRRAARARTAARRRATALAVAASRRLRARSCAAAALAAGQAAQAVGHVVARAEVGKERVVLEYHSAAPALGRHRNPARGVQPDLPVAAHDAPGGPL